MKIMKKQNMLDIKKIISFALRSDVTQKLTHKINLKDFIL